MTHRPSNKKERKIVIKVALKALKKLKLTEMRRNGTEDLKNTQYGVRK